MFVIKWSNKNNVRTELLNIIKSTIKTNNWKQAKAGNVLQLSQPKISLIKSLKVSEFSLEKILVLLSRLKCEVKITVNRREKFTGLQSG